MFHIDYQTAMVLDLQNKIKQLSTFGKPQQEFLFACINEFHNGEHRKFMLKAQEYYVNDNDIKDRKRYYIDRRGIQREATNLTNTKLCHPFMRKLVNQKINYLLSKEFSIQCDDDQFATHLQGYLDKKFMKRLKNIGRDSIVNGIAWVQVYYNDKGELNFKRIPCEEIIPFWSDADHTELDAIIRYYTIIRYLPDGVKEEVVKVEYHTREGVWYYLKGEKGLIPDPDYGDGANGHFLVEQNPNKPQSDDGEQKQGLSATWQKIPFVAFKYNADETSLLKWVKTLIDDYDVNTSDTSNNLQDIPNSIKVVKNYDGTDKGEFTQNLAIFRTAFVSGDGDMKAIETTMDTTAVESHLTRLRKDIYEAGNGVDTQEASLGTASGVALKFRYVDLDTDTDDMAAEYAASLQELIWFVKIDIFNKGLGDYTETDYEIIFNTDNIINEQEIIECAKNSVGVISEETIIANHPWVTNTQQELERLQGEREQQMESMLAGYEDFGEYPQDEDVNELNS